MVFLIHPVILSFSALSPSAITSSKEGSRFLLYPRLFNSAESALSFSRFFLILSNSSAALFTLISFSRIVLSNSVLAICTCSLPGPKPPHARHISYACDGSVRQTFSGAPCLLVLGFVKSVEIITPSACSRRIIAPIIRLSSGSWILPSAISISRRSHKSSVVNSIFCATTSLIISSARFPAIQSGTSFAC